MSEDKGEGTPVPESEQSVKSPVQPNYTKMRDDECIPVAIAILKCIAAQDEIMIGSSETINEADVIKHYSSFYENAISNILIESDVKVKDIPFIFQLIGQAIQFTQERVTNTVDTRYDQAVAKALGVEQESDMRIHNIQDILVEKKDTEK